MEEKSLEKEVLLSHGRCSQQGLATSLSRPRKKVSEKKLKAELEAKQQLVKTFNKGVEEIEPFMDSGHLFLLTNPDAILLVKKSKGVRNICLKRGMSFRAESSGTNAVSLARKLKSQVFLMPNQHYCDFLKQWSCFAVPLGYKNRLIGLLTISSIGSELKDEAKGITLLLRDRIENELKQFETNDKPIELTSKQKEVLHQLSCGLTEKQIAEKMYCSRNTIKYHKKVIFNKLEVNTTRGAVVKGVKLGLVNLNKVSI